MKFKKSGNSYLLRLDRNEELVESIKDFCKENGIRAGTVSGLGASGKIKVGLFEPAAKKFISGEFTGDFEITNITGNISTLDGEIYTHIHISFADRDFNARGGHLVSAVISGTGELIINAMEETVERYFDDETGLNIYRF